ncbi:hypothetical protein ACE6H2_017183 [Prunus campanulata]
MAKKEALVLYLKRFQEVDCVGSLINQRTVIQRRLFHRVLEDSKAQFNTYIVNKTDCK